MTAFQTPGPIAVTLDVAAGNITLVASDRTDTVVEVRPTDASKKNDVRAAKQIQVDFTAGALTVQTPKGWRTYSPFSGNASVDVIIEVPTGSGLTGTLGVGHLLGAGALGPCEVEVSMGDITVERPLGAVTAKTAKGDIRIGEATRGELRLETSMGDLTVGIHPGSAARMETNTPSGTVHNQLGRVDHPQDVVRVHARTSYGNITIGHAAAV
ncbi:DUF4097 family beta strand repeat-containing protein [Nocardia aurantiaca]|uniref:DUF4097 family beta strand repeat protein n=1 Tax=Nocardia aurantiaca TaxID=2675850 RepID=A0A6I3KQK5_9NOCA|nr:DUF4097 family beta strand repeat-containing protein [Nocardia aurantiaca]MTE11406.1 DUF4097 family beta strand repeat protein [Nocardia aurantiaca]